MRPPTTFRARSRSGSGTCHEPAVSSVCRSTDREAKSTATRPNRNRIESPWASFSSTVMCATPAPTPRRRRPSLSNHSAFFDKSAGATANPPSAPWSTRCSPNRSGQRNPSNVRRPTSSPEVVSVTTTVRSSPRTVHNRRAAVSTSTIFASRGRADVAATSCRVMVGEDSSPREARSIALGALGRSLTNLRRALRAIGRLVIDLPDALRAIGRSSTTSAALSEQIGAHGTTSASLSRVFPAEKIAGRAGDEDGVSLSDNPREFTPGALRARRPLAGGCAPMELRRARGWNWALESSSSLSRADFRGSRVARRRCSGEHFQTVDAPLADDAARAMVEA